MTQLEWAGAALAGAFVLMGFAGVIAFRTQRRQATELEASVQQLTESVRIDENQKRYAGISGELQMTLNMEGHVSWANDVVEKMLGWTKEEIGERPFQEFLIHPEDLERVAMAWADAASGGPVASFQVRLARKDGSWCWIVGDAVTDPEAGVIYTVSREINELKEVEAALRDAAAREQQTASQLSETEQLFSRAFDDSSLGIALVDREGIAMKVNSAFAAMLGYTPKELTGMSVVSLTHPEDSEEAIALVTKLFSGEIAHYHMDKRYLTKSGDVIWGSLFASSIKDQDGKPIYAFGLVQDITERKSVEERVASFLSHAAHDLRTPVGIITGMASTLRDRGKAMPEESFRAGLDMLVRQGDRARKLIESLLDFSRLERAPVPERTEVGLRALAEESVAMVVLPQGTSARVEIDEGLKAKSDRALLERVLVNLLTNAGRHGGQNVVVSGRSDESSVWMEVSDDGIGVEPDLARRVFEPFTHGDKSEKDGETSFGLGLAIARSAVRLAGGEITYRPGSHGGACFSVRLQPAG